MRLWFMGISLDRELPQTRFDFLQVCPHQNRISSRRSSRV